MTKSENPSPFNPQHSPYALAQFTTVTPAITPGATKQKQKIHHIVLAL